MTTTVTKTATKLARHPITHIPASSLHVSRPTYWLTSRFHFSFSDYYDPAKERFGVLRVINDDIVVPDSGFGRHGHRDMEICTYVVDGELSHQHKDVHGKGASEALGRGAVQYMSAGQGVTHSELNESETTPVRFLQLWILPDRAGHTPNYGSRRFTLEDRADKLLRVVSGQLGVKELAPPTDSSVPIHQDANIYVSEFTKPGKLTFPVADSRQVYLVCIEGELVITGAGKTVRMGERDGLTVRGGVSDFTIEGVKPGAHLLMVEMAKDETDRFMEE